MPVRFRLQYVRFRTLGVLTGFIKINFYFMNNSLDHTGQFVYICIDHIGQSLRILGTYDSKNINGRS